MKTNRNNLAAKSSLLLVALLIGCFVPFLFGHGNVQAASQTQAKQWMDNLISQKKVVNNGGTQCVAVFNEYLGAVFGINWRDYYGGVSIASAIYDQDPPPGFRKIDGSNSFQVGDIIVVGGNPGHVAIVYAINGSTVTMFHQHWRDDGTTMISYAHTTNMTSGTKSKVRGVIRPSFEAAQPAPSPANTATIKDGTYVLKNVGSGYAMNYAYGISNPNPIWLAGYGNEDKNEQHFKFVHTGDGKYRIEITHSDSGVINCECSTVSAGVKLTGRGNSNNDTQKFYVTSVGNNEYILQCAANKDLVIGAPSASNHAKLELQYYDKNNALQKWSFAPDAAIPTATPTPVPATATPVPPTATPTTAATPTSKPTATAKPTATPTTAPKATDTAAPTVTSNPSSKDAKVLDFVNRIYKFVLDREPEKEGAAFWTDELVSLRQSGAEVAQGFIFSEEFVNRKTNDIEFVTILYKTFFGRDPEAEGLDYWVGMLKSGEMDRTTVANGFIFSQEWTDTCAQYGIKSGAETSTPSGDKAPTAATVSLVERMYTTALKRDFDKQGRDYWASELANLRITGESLGLSFFLSDEMNSLNLNDKEFINRLYKTFMDRDSDAAGEEFWQGFLTTHTRSEAVLGFTRSEEFVKKCVEAQILPY